MATCTLAASSHARRASLGKVSALGHLRFVSPYPQIELLRPRVEDAVSLARYADDAAVFAGLRDYFPHPYSVDDALRFIDTVLAKDGKQTDWLIHVDGEAVGVMGLFIGEDVYRRNAEIGYWIGRPHWGKGIMTHSINWTLDYAWRELDVDRVYAEVFSTNHGSLRVLEKCGFEVEYVLPNTVVKLGQRCDSICLGIRRP